jgi:Tol biopolymer transport system component
MYSLELSSLTALDELLSGTKSPISFKLHQNYPNPFNRSTKISFHLSQPGTVQILVYDVLGREVYRFTDDIDNSGEHSVIWESRANNGMEMASGVYYYQAVWNGMTVSEAPKKMILLK